MKTKIIRDHHGTPHTIPGGERDYAVVQSMLRDFATDWQNEFATKSVSYGEIVEVEDYFARYGERYGLLREFKENGIL